MNEMLMPPDDIRAAADQLDVALRDEQWQQLARYLNLLLEHNQRFNLTGIRDPHQAWHRHVIDSLTLLPGLNDLDDHAAVVDVGTGGGLPGIPLAIARPDIKMSLLDATAKKLRFLELVIEDLALQRCSVIEGRAETIGQDSRFRERFDLAVSRAVGPMAQLLEYVLPLVRVGGWALAMKGPSVEEELKGAGDALMKLGGGDVEVIQAYPEAFDIDTVIVAVAKTQATPKDYPRAPGIPKQSPL